VVFGVAVAFRFVRPRRHLGRPAGLVPCLLPPWPCPNSGETLSFSIDCWRAPRRQPPLSFPPFFLRDSCVEGERAAQQLLNVPQVVSRLSFPFVPRACLRFGRRSRGTRTASVSTNPRRPSVFPRPFKRPPRDGVEVPFPREDF